MQYDTLSKILEYIPYQADTLSNLSLVSKDIHDIITLDEYKLLWNYYTNNAPYPLNIPNVKWTRLVDLFKNRIIIGDDPSILLPNEPVRTPRMPGRRAILKSQPKIVSTIVDLFKNRIQYITLRCNNNHTCCDISITHGGKVYYYSMHTNQRILTLITDVYNGILYFIDDDIHRYHIPVSKKDTKLTLKLDDGPLDIIKDIDDRLIDILVRYGEEIFTNMYNMRPHTHT